MKVMVLVKSTKECEAGVMPTREQLAEMGQFSDPADTAYLASVLEAFGRYF